MSVFSDSDLGIWKVGDNADREVLRAAGKAGAKARARSWVVAESALKRSSCMSPRVKMLYRVFMVFVGLLL